MPTVGWIQDSAFDRITDAFPFSPVAPERTKCPLCVRTFADREEMLTHLGVEHPMERPLLRVGARTGLDRYELRSPFDVHDIEALSCTACEVATNGQPGKPVAPAKLAGLLKRAGNATHLITLRNGRGADEGEAVANVELRGAIPKPETFVEIDRKFIEHLAHDRIDIRMVDAFRRSVEPEAAAVEYLGALADYAVGVVIKEQRPDAGAGEDFAKFSEKFQNSRRQLENFRRPLAGAVVALIDFNLNNFRNGGLAKFPDLENAHRFFWALANGKAGAGRSAPKPSTSLAACPADAVTAAIWNAIGPFPNVPALLDASPDLPGTTGMSLSEYDLAKLRALKASAALLLNHRILARDHFRALRHDPKFGPWAESHLEAPSIS